MIRHALLVFAVVLLSVVSVRSQECAPPASLVHRAGETSEVAHQASSGPILTVPSDTQVSVQLLSGIHSEISHPDDAIQARLLQPVYVGQRLALPLGTYLDGRILRVTSAGRLHHPAQLAFRFDRVTLPDGQVAAIDATMTGFELPGRLNVHLNAEGHLRGTRGFSWKGLTGSLLTLGTFGMLKAAGVGSAAVACALPAAGGALLAYQFLWTRGGDVHLPPETRFHLRLNSPLTVRVAG